MANFEYDSNSENDWDDSWEILWNEFDWEKYLKSEDKQIQKYAAHYEANLANPERLEQVANDMDWEVHLDPETNEDWDLTADAWQEPYTLHKHPLFIASKALHSWLSKELGKAVEQSSSPPSTQEALRLQAGYHESETLGLLAVTALDVGDFALAIAYLKRGMASLNASMSLLATFGDQRMLAYMNNARMRIFDVREVWLRVIADCRAAIAKQSEEE